MELSRPVVVQQHRQFTLTLDFQGQILKMLYLRNGRTDQHGTKGYESIGYYAYFVTFSYDLDLGFSRSNFETDVSKEWEGRLTYSERDVSRQDVRPTL